MSTAAKYLRSIRQRILSLSHAAKSAHVGSGLSCVEILYALFDAQKKKAPEIETIILSKGHAAMALYASLEAFEKIPSSELEVYLKNGTRLWGHPSKKSNFAGIDWSTGALGHGMPVTVGMAYAALHIDKSEAIFTTVISDGECNEGSIWEAALFAGHHKLRNLVTIIDYNKIQSFGRISDVLELEPFAKKWESFGWWVSEVDGHDVSAIQKELLKDALRPKCIIAHTIKGKGVPSIENSLASHYKPITSEQLELFKNEK